MRTTGDILDPSQLRVLKNEEKKKTIQKNSTLFKSKKKVHSKN